jgi:hypothetical protein
VTASADLIPSARNVLYKIQAKYYDVGVGNVQIGNLRAFSVLSPPFDGTEMLFKLNPLGTMFI